MEKSLKEAIGETSENPKPKNFLQKIPREIMGLVFDENEFHNVLSHWEQNCIISQSDRFQAEEGLANPETRKLFLLFVQTFAADWIFNDVAMVLAGTTAVSAKSALTGVGAWAGIFLPYTIAQNLYIRYYLRNHPDKNIIANMSALPFFGKFSTLSSLSDRYPKLLPLFFAYYQKKHLYKAQQKLKPEQMAQRYVLALKEKEAVAKVIRRTTKVNEFVQSVQNKVKPFLDFPR